MHRNHADVRNGASRASRKGREGMNMETEEQQSEESINECVELSAALEKQRAIKIIEDVMSLPIGGGDSLMPTAFQAGYQLACEESMHRIKTEVWELNLPPDGVAIGAS